MKIKVREHRHGYSKIDRLAIHDKPATRVTACPGFETRLSMASTRESQAARSAPKFPAPKAPQPRPNPTASRMPFPQALRAPPKRVDTSSPAYKAASRKYISVMIATPILLVTSYVLFDRLVMGNEAKTLSRKPAAQEED